MFTAESSRVLGLPYKSYLIGPMSQLCFLLEKFSNILSGALSQPCSQALLSYWDNAFFYCFFIFLEFLTASPHTLFVDKRIIFLHHIFRVFLFFETHLYGLRFLTQGLPPGSLHHSFPIWIHCSLGLNLSWDSLFFVAYIFFFLTHFRKPHAQVFS